MANRGVYGLNMLQLFGEPVTAGSVLERSLNGVLEGFQRGEFRTVVGKTFPLAEGGAAHAFLQSRGNVGKVVLVV